MKMLKPRIATLNTSTVKTIDQRIGATPRQRGRKWMAIRERIFSRDCGLCQQCKRQGRVRAGTQVDHIIALTNGGTNDDSNLESICDDCHDTKTDADLGHRAKVTIGADGWPVEPSNNAPGWKRRGCR